MQHKKTPLDKQSLAAITIQKNWRRFVAHRLVKKLLKRQKKKVMTAKQLIQSERTYCENLQFVIKEVMGPSRNYIPDRQMHSCLFGNIEEIHTLHSNFLEQLQKVMKNYHPHLTKLSQVLLKELFNRNEFKQVYTNYCYNYKSTDQTIKFLVANNPAFNEHLRRIGLISINLTLQSYMIKPVQRLCKYSLIIDEYTRNMEKDHVDHTDIEKTSILISKLVHQTNDQVEEFLMRERLNELKRLFPTFFNKINSTKKPRMYYETKGITLLDVVKQQQLGYKSMALFQNSIILIPKQLDAEPTFINFFFIRELVNHKYYKQIVQLINQNRYSYIQFREEKDKKQFMRILNDKMLQQNQPQFKQYVKVAILGTETRESFFSSYTVYIVNIDDNSKVSTIYPRFKDLLKVQQLMISKGMRFDPPLLAKQSIISTLKSKTIQKRKLTIQQFLERVFNNCEVSQIKEIQEILGVSQISSNTIFQKASSQLQEISVQLPNLQKLKVLIPVHESKIRDLKMLISQQMGMESTNQFQIFQIRNKSYSSKKLLYDDEPVKKIYDEQKESSLSINPFRDTLDYLYTRYYYLSRQEEEELYKSDQVRAQLELSVIHSEILNYRLEEEVMLTFMCLFAMYIHLPFNSSDKLNFFIKEICKKAYKVSEEEFMIYYNEVKRMVSGEDSIAQSLPIVIIKIVANSYLYQCQQFDAEVHHKIYSQLRKAYPNVEEKLILGLHPNTVYLLSVKERNVLVKFSYSQLTIVETHPNAVVFEMMHTQLQLILKTLQAFQISKIFEIYKKKS